MPSGRNDVARAYSWNAEKRVSSDVRLYDSSETRLIGRLVVQQQLTVGYTRLHDLCLLLTATMNCTNCVFD